MRRLLLLTAAVALALAAPAHAADVHIDAQDRTGPLTTTADAGGAWKASVSGVSTTFTAAEAKAFADLVKPDPPPDPQCQNGKDDDADGKVDLLDPDCTGPDDNNEAALDRDGDGVADSSDLCPDVFAQTPDGCPPVVPPPPTGTQGKVGLFRSMNGTEMDNTMLAALPCHDGLDNDGDGKTDTADDNCDGNAAKAASDFILRFDRFRVYQNECCGPADKMYAQTPKWAPLGLEYHDVMRAQGHTSTTAHDATLADEFYLWDGPPTLAKCATPQATTTSCRQRLFVDWGCVSATAGCPQYAYDLGNPNARKRYVDAAVGPGKKAGGLFMDDVRWYFQVAVSSGTGAFVRPWNPRTNARMTDDEWSAALLQTVKDTKAALPDPYEVVTNAVPYHGTTTGGILTNQWAKEAFGVIDGWEIEGATVGQDVSGYQAPIDYGHSQGAYVVHDIQNTSLSRTYTLAVYLCFNDGTDYYGHPDMRPSLAWDPLWDKDLGAATTACVKGTDGIYRRTYERGTVTVNPATKTATIS